MSDGEGGAIDVIAQERTLTTAPAMPQAGLLLRYAPGRRPSGAMVETALSASDRSFVSHRPARGSQGLDPGWLELLRDGLTFDCLGLAPGPGLEIPQPSQRLGLVSEGILDLEAIGIFAGPHCAAAAASLPLVRAQMALACTLVENLADPVEAIWSPAALAVAPQMFASQVASWLAGGPFPALALVAYRHVPGSGLHSQGLAFFTGQELRIGPDVAADPIAATRLAARLVHELVAAAPVAVREAFTGPDGRALVLVPSDDGRLVTVVGA